MHFQRATAWLLPLAACANAAQKPLYSTTFDPSNATIYQLSADPEFSFLLDTTITLAPAEGASTGEVLYIATQIEPTNFESVYNAFFPFAEKINALAESIDSRIDPDGARQTFFRAATYYRQSVFYLVGNASDPRLYSVWTKFLNAFNKATALLSPAPARPVTLHAKNSSIGPYDVPAYFFKGSASDEKLPVVVAGTGYDGTQQDMYHLACSQVLQRGIHCMTYEGPGQPTVRREQHLPFIPDWYTAVTPVVDYLYTRSDVDTSKIVLLGDSFGGTLAPLAAAKEPRLSGLILNDGLPSLRQALIDQFPPQLVALYNDSKVEEFNKEVYSIIDSPEYPTDFRDILIYTLWVFNSTTPYDAWGQFGNMSWGLQTAAEIGKMPVYIAKGQDDTTTGNEPQLARQYLENERPNGKDLTYYHEFLTDLGAGLHTSIGAESQVWVNIFAWLSKIWGDYKFGDNM